MKRTFLPPALAALFVAVGAVWLLPDPTGETAGQTRAVVDEQAALERMRERTLWESRAGVEAPLSEAAPTIYTNDWRARAAPPPSTEPPEAGVSGDRLSEGYSLGEFVVPCYAPCVQVLPVPNRPPIRIGSDRASRTMQFSSRRRGPDECSHLACYAFLRVWTCRRSIVLSRRWAPGSRVARARMSASVSRPREHLRRRLRRGRTLGSLDGPEWAR